MVYSAEKYSNQQKRLVTRENWVLEDAKKKPTYVAKLALPYLYKVCSRKNFSLYCIQIFCFSFFCEPVTFLSFHPPKYISSSV